MIEDKEYKAFSEMFFDFIEVVKKHEKTLASERMKIYLAKAKEKGSQIGNKPDEIKLKKIDEMWEQGFSVAEIAEKVELTGGGVRYNLHKLGKKLKKGRPKP